MSCERIRMMFAAIDDRDWERLTLHFSPDAVYFRPGYAPICGREEIDRFYRETRIVAAGQHALERIVITGDAAACWGRFQGIARDGRDLDEQFADVYALSNGLVRIRTTYFFRAAI